MENSLNVRGKNHGRQPVSNFTMIGVRLQTPIVTAYKKYNESISNGKPCRMDLPGPTTSVGTRTDYSMGP
jgi:hypothetical protein